MIVYVCYISINEGDVELYYEFVVRFYFNK